MKKLLAFIAFSFIAPGVALAQGPLANLPKLSEAAPDTKQISPHVPHMGEHWANPANLPTGPIYCVIEGRITCVEYIFTAKELTAGKDWTRLATGIETPPISYIDVEFKPKGIKPMPEPLYQVHIYFVDREFLSKH